MSESNEKSVGVGAGEYMAWGEVGNKPKKFEDKKYIEHLSLKEGVPYKIRLLGKPYRFQRHYDVIHATSPGFDLDAAWQAGHAPKERYAILILDRNDGNKLKVLEAGPGVFNEFKSYFELKQVDPGGKKGPNWIIQVKVPTRIKDGKSYKDRRQTQYRIIADDPAPLNAEEAKYVQENWQEVKNIKKPTDPELIKEMMNDAKTRSDSDPVPGSNDWWLKRKSERSESGSTNSDSSAVKPNASSEPEDEKFDESNVDDLFGADSDDDSVKF